MRFWLPIIAMLISQAASAEIYKCRLPNNKTEISNIPCPTGSGTVTARPDEHVSEASRLQAERDVKRMRDYVDKREAVQRADAASERQERISQQQAAAANASRAPRPYSSAEECRHALEQTPPDAPQRAQMEAECQSMVKPQTVYVPLYVPASPPRVHSPPPPAPKPAPPSAPKISAPQLQK